MPETILHTGLEPEVIRSVFVEYDPDAREIVVHDCIQEDGQRGARSTHSYTVDDAGEIGHLLLAEVARARFFDDPRQLGMF
jgi:hypothetical protein